MAAAVCAEVHYKPTQSLSQQNDLLAAQLRAMFISDAVVPGPDCSDDRDFSD